MLPDGWNFKNINEIDIQVIDGDRGKNYPKDNEFQSTGSCLFLSAKNVTKAGFDFSLGQFITNEKHKLLNKGEVKVGDIVITTRGSIGHFAYYNHKKYQSMRINSGMAILRPNVNYTYPDFLYEVCRSQIVKTQIEKASFGSAQPQLTIAIIKKFRIPVPPLPEQKKIAAILSTWDRAIEGTEKLLANSQQQKKALMQQLLTGKKRLPGFTGEWKNTKVGNYISERKKRNKNSISQLVLSITNRHGFENPEEYFSKRVASSDISNYKIVKTGDFGYNPSRINVGSFARLKKHTTAVVSPIYVVFHTSEKNLDGTYFDFWMHSHSAQQQVLNSTQGSVRNSVNFDSLCQFKIKLPPLPEQKAIAAVLTTADEEITALESDLSRLRQEKKSLMQQLLTGKRRVTVD